MYISARILVMGACCCLAPAAVARAATERCVAVVGTNDLHGAIAPYTITARDAEGPHTVEEGGVLGLSGYIHTLRAVHGDRMVLLDGGDLFQGTLPSNMSLGKAIIDAYNILGYSAAAIGNHEFDFGALPGGSDRIGVLKARIAESRFPFLAANVFENDQPIAWPNTRPSLLMDAGGVKVGIIGVSTVETPKVTKPDNVRTLQFRDPVPVVAAEARALRGRGAELVVLVGHVGGKCKDRDDPNDIASCSTHGADGELFALLQALPPGAVDVAVGGHTHQVVAHWVNGTATLESGARGHYLGYVEACLDGAGRFDPARSRIHAATPLCLTAWSDGRCNHKRKPLLPVAQASFLGRPVAILPPLQQAMQPYLDGVAELGARPIGAVLPESLGGFRLAALVAEGMRRSLHADFSVQNRGGVRATLPAGPLTFSQVFQVLPFDNKVLRARMTGAQVVTLVELMMRCGHGAPPPLAGLDVRGGKVTDGKGAPLDPTANYFFAISDFLQQGGEGLDAVFQHVPADAVEDPDIFMRDAFIELLQQVYPG